MTTQISYTPPALQVIRNEVCYRLSGSSDVLSGFYVVSYMGDEEMQRRLETLQGEEVLNYELTPCPITIQQKLDNKQVLPLRNKKTLAVIYSVNRITENGSISTAYFNIDGSPYIGDVNDLELATDNLNYSGAVIFCHKGTDTISRTDVWDESRNLVAVIWQDTIGRIIPEPTGTLKPGACDLLLDTEIIKQTDNILSQQGNISGNYVSFYRVNVHDSNGNVVYSRSKLADGINYNTVGRVTVEPVVPPVVGFLRRIELGQEWESNSNIQSCSFAVEYANKNSVVQITTPDSVEPVVISKLNYNMKWSVDGSDDPNLLGIKIKAFNFAKVLVNWTEQLPLVEITPNPSTPTDPLDTQIPIPAELN